MNATALAPIVSSHDRARQRRLLLSFGWQAPGLAQPAASASLRPNGYVRLDPDRQITIWSKNPDMGQGVKTAFAMILAEEMDADWSRVQVLDAELNRALFGGQGSGGSGSMRDEWDLYRNAGAAIREMLADTAAESWRVPRAECRTERGRVLHAATNRAQNFGDLATAASTRTAPAQAGLEAHQRVHAARHARARRGQPADRHRAPALRDRRPSAQHEVRRHRQMPGVRRPGRARGRCGGAEGAGGATGRADRRPRQPDVPDARRRRRRGLDVGGVQGARCAPGAVGRRPVQGREHRDAVGAVRGAGAGARATVRAVGDVEQALAGAARVVEAYYEFPFLSHATLEPHNCTADVRDGHCYITGPLQMQGSGAIVVAAAVGLPVDRVHIQVTRLGGGFGRRLLSDYAAEAAVVSKAIGGPVQVIGTREDDLRHDYYRPAGARRLRAGLDANGRIVAWDCHMVNLSRNAYRRGTSPAWSTETYGMVAGVSNDLGPDLELDLVPWHIPNVRLQFSEPRLGRGDRGLARARARVERVCGRDAPRRDRAADWTQCRGVAPGALRQRRRAPHHGRRSDAVRSGSHGRGVAPGRRAWRLRAGGPAGRARGLAAHFTFGSYCAQVVELSVDPPSREPVSAGRRVTIHRVTCALDCGIVVNRSGVEAQAQGGIIDGLGHAFFGEVTIDRGRAVEGNFDRYRLIRNREAPAAIDIHIVPSTMRPTGFGEIAVPVVAPAVANAVAAITGERIRRTPFARSGYTLEGARSSSA